jgi:acetyl esterase
MTPSTRGRSPRREASYRHAMALWPDDYEGLREEARAMAETIADTFSVMSGGASPTGRDERVRAQREMLAALEVASPAGVDENIAGVPCRVFRPTVPVKAVYLHFHGGAMMLGSPLLNDVANADVAERLDLAVVSVDYRLAPEYPFPAGADDCLAVAAWLVEHAEAWFGTGDLVIGGESAGGYYAALTLLRVRDELGAIDRFHGANLVFGVYDLSGTPATHGFRPSETPDILDLDTFAFVHECYLPGRTPEDARVPEISPLYADLRDLPPALFTVGTADHLLDDSLFMAARWAAYGNDAELAVYPDCVHGFTGFPIELAKRANERIDDFLARAAG